MENGLDEQPMFDTDLLKRLDWSARKANFKNGVSPSNPGDNLILRPLRVADFDRGFMQLLKQLTSIGDVSKEDFRKRFEAMKNCSDTYYIPVIEDTTLNQVVGTATLVIEQKFIHSTGTRGRIEDVVVSSDQRGKQLGKLLVECLTLLGKELGVYKMSLECEPDNVNFYNSFGYKPDGQYFMVQRMPNDGNRRVAPNSKL